MNQKEVRLSGLRPSSVAMFEGVFGAILGVVVSIMYLLSSTITVSNETNSLLQGLLLGLTVGAFSLIVLPVVYFAIGWVVGIVHGFIFNMVLQASGGLRVDVSEDERERAAMEPEPAQYATPSRTDPAFGERIERRPPKQ